jgi:membrane associated rhomboid family serine protease
MIGASGAISGVLGAYLLLHPHARILVIIPIGFIVYTPWIAAYWVLGFWFILQLINSMVSASDVGGVAYGAHIGGFVAGMLLIPLFKYSSVPLFSPLRKK